MFQFQHGRVVVGGEYCPVHDGVILISTGPVGCEDTEFEAAEAAASTYVASHGHYKARHVRLFEGDVVPDDARSPAGQSRAVVVEVPNGESFVFRGGFTEVGNFYLSEPVHEIGKHAGRAVIANTISLTDAEWSSVLKADGLEQLFRDVVFGIRTVPEFIEALSALAEEAAGQKAAGDVGMEMLSAIELREKYGHWNEHPEYPVSDWQYEVDNGDTRLGYWEWVEGRLC